MDLAKFVDKGVQVKLTGGRQGHQFFFTFLLLLFLDVDFMDMDFWIMICFCIVWGDWVKESKNERTSSVFT